MLETMSPTEELKPEQQEILNQLEAEAKANEPKVEEPKPVVAPVEPAKVEEPVMQVSDPDVEEDTSTDVRQPKFVRLEKHLKMRDKVKELEEELMAYKSKPLIPEATPTVDEVSAYAEANGYDAEQTKKLVEIIEKNAAGRLEKQFADKFNQLNEVAEKAKRDNEELEQEKIWNKQYSELLEKYPEEKSHIESIKGTIQKLAYSKEFHQAPLTAAYAYLKEVEGLKPNAHSKTVESGTGGQSKGGIDYATIVATGDQEAIKAMNQTEFEGLKAYIKANNL